GLPLVYSSGNIALACLETLVHIKLSLPLNRYLIQIDIPLDVWNARMILAAPLPVGWDAEPAGTTSITKGDQWIFGGTTAILEVPSVLVPEESNFLINPSHPTA